MQQKAFSLNVLLKEIIAETLISFPHAVTLEESLPVDVYADRDKTGQVIRNLLSIAVKYSPKGSLITGRVKCKKKRATVSVSDKGVGVAGADLEKLFNLFFLVEGEQAEAISGFGIGLYLSGEIIRSHDGKIWVESEPGESSIFYFDIP